jgi:hypothetical protein
MILVHTHMRALPIGSAIPPSNAVVPDYADMPAPKTPRYVVHKKKVHPRCGAFTEYTPSVPRSLSTHLP